MHADGSKIVNKRCAHVKEDNNLNLLLMVIGPLFLAYEYRFAQQENILVFEHKILLLAADPSEKRPFIGAVDMAFFLT